MSNLSNNLLANKKVQIDSFNTSLILTFFLVHLTYHRYLYHIFYYILVNKESGYKTTNDIKERNFEL